MIEKPLTKQHSGTQTDTHFYEENIVSTYEWNEWELRRKAMKLANMRGKITTSMQTNLSSSKRDIAVQCFPGRAKGTQTKRDNYTNVPKPHVFLAGLRGGGMNRPTEMVKTDLTIDIEQT
ncbi:hypothetical protein NP493_637g01006 [Ridgeia piscesae]|uniref:Cilia- and flagella-associated protein 206 n=1 Tax=Ridgeia piscesae TaxID=27915 RepID=A0AAD9KU67_RIDPI|nr:hypothetical protein NP493_637g01006 [Ridgeia piscesae]